MTATLRHALIVTAWGLTLQLAAAQSLPGVERAPAPAWVRPGVRLAYDSSIASTPASPYYYTPNENGDWQSGDGKRWDQWKQPGAAGRGVTLVDLVAVGPRQVRLDVQAWQRDLLSGLVCPIAGARAASACPPGGGDWWIAPGVLAGIAQRLEVDPTSLDELKILRMRMTMPDGTQRDVLRHELHREQARQILAYERSTGLLVYKATCAQGRGGRFSRGSTVISQLWLTARRQRRIPWAGQPLHAGLTAGKTFAYAGSTTIAVPSSGGTLRLPLTAELRVRAVGRSWFTYDQTTRVTAPRGMPPQPPRTDRLIGGAGTLDSIWIPPAALRALQPGQLLDRDPAVGEAVRVTSTGPARVVLTARSQALVVVRTYDTASGLLRRFVVTGGPRPSVRTQTQAQLVRGGF